MSRLLVLVFNDYIADLVLAVESTQRSGIYLQTHLGLELFDAIIQWSTGPLRKSLVTEEIVLDCSLDFSIGDPGFLPVQASVIEEPASLSLVSV